jgi:phosphonate transport system substrate-binding protein
LGDVCNVTVGYTDLDSSSGYVYPKLMLLKHLKKTNRLNRCKIREVFLDGHKGVLDAVAAGDVDVGATFANDTHGKFGAWKQLGAYSVRAIAVTDAIPSDGLFVPKTMSPAMQKKISSAFRELLETEDGKVMLEKLFRAQKLVPTKDADYDGVVSVVSQFRAMTGTFR